MARRVASVLKAMAPSVRNKNLGEIEAVLGTAICHRFPPGSRGFVPTIERTDAGKHQANAVTPADSEVAKLRQRAGIFLDLPPSGCIGLQFNSNSDDLADVIAGSVADVGGPGREGLLALVLQPTGRKSDG